LQPGSATGLIVQDFVEYDRMTTGGTKTLSVIPRDAYFNQVPSTPVIFEVLQGTCTIAGGGSTTSDGSGVASVTVSVPGSLSSCVVKARVNVAGSAPFVQQRIYVAPDGIYVWTGKQSGSWTVDTPGSLNWLGGAVPPNGAAVFIPGASAFDNTPTVIADTTVLHSLVVESGATLTLNQKYIAVNDSLAIVGYILGGGVVEAAGSGASFRAPGVVHALLKIGPTADYTVSGPVNADTLMIMGFFRIDKDVELSIGGLLQTVPNQGRLYQSAGSIFVSGNADFSGFTSNLSGGLLEIKGNFSNTGDCEVSRFNATGTHTVRMTSGASDTTYMNWNAPCQSQFATLEIANTGSAAVAFNAGGSTYVPKANTLNVRSGATFSLSTLTIFTIANGGKLNVASGGVLRLFGTMNVGACDKPLEAGNNTGPFSCEGVLAF
jgi:hypothetical protein